MSSTSIEWSDDVWNPIVGCSKISEGCRNCYAEKAAKSPRLQQFSQYQKVSEWDGSIEFVDNIYYGLLSKRKSKTVFVCSMADLFHQNVRVGWIDKILLMVMAQPHLTFRFLTKRPQKMLNYFSQNRLSFIDNHIGDLLLYSKDKRFHLENLLQSSTFYLKHGYFKNLWLGTTVENEEQALSRIPLLTQIKGNLFLSCEPLLEQIDFSRLELFLTLYHDLSDQNPFNLDLVKWVIVGGESGTNSRFCDIQWISKIVDYCTLSDKLVFVKQLGQNSNHPRFNSSDTKRSNLHGFPSHLKIRQIPV